MDKAGGPRYPSLGHQQPSCPEMAWTEGPGCSYSMTMGPSCVQWPPAKAPAACPPRETSGRGVAAPPRTHPGSPTAGLTPWPRPSWTGHEGPAPTCTRWPPSPTRDSAHPPLAPRPFASCVPCAEVLASCPTSGWLRSPLPAGASLGPPGMSEPPQRFPRPTGPPTVKWAQPWRLACDPVWDISKAVEANPGGSQQEELQERVSLSLSLFSSRQRGWHPTCCNSACTNPLSASPPPP